MLVTWKNISVENEDHCDFKKLRSLLIRTHMPVLDLISTSEELHYENWELQTSADGDTKIRRAKGEEAGQPQTQTRGRNIEEEVYRASEIRGSEI